MADLVLFGFVLSFLTFVESKVSTGASTVYLSGRKYTPAVLDKALDSAEVYVSACYESAKSWLQEKGSACVGKADQQVAGWLAVVKDKAAASVPESFYASRAYWLNACEHVSTTWKELGVIQGTAHIAGALSTKIKESLSAMMEENSFLKSTMGTFEANAVFMESKQHFEAAAQSMFGKSIAWIKNLPANARELWAARQGYLEATTEKMESFIDYVVGHPTYAKVISAGSSAGSWMKATPVFAAAVDRVYIPYLESYFSPIISTITESDAYGAIIDRFTPIKQE